MRRLMVCASIVIAGLCAVTFLVTNSVQASPDKTVVLYCTDVGESLWSRSTVGNHLLIAPEPASGDMLLNGVHTEVIDLSTHKGFVDQGDPMHPVDNNSIGPLTATIAPTAIRLNNSLPATYPQEATYVNITIDRRTGLYFETRQIFDRNKQVVSTDQSMKLCGTNKTLF